DSAGLKLLEFVAQPVAPAGTPKDLASEFINPHASLPELESTLRAWGPGKARPSEGSGIPPVLSATMALLFLDALKIRFETKSTPGTASRIAYTSEGNTERPNGNFVGDGDKRDALRTYSGSGVEVRRVGCRSP